MYRAAGARTGDAEEGGAAQNGAEVLGVCAGAKPARNVDDSGAGPGPGSAGGTDADSEKACAPEISSSAIHSGARPPARAPDGASGAQDGGAAAPCNRRNDLRAASRGRLRLSRAWQHGRLTKRRVRRGRRDELQRRRVQHEPVVRAAVAQHVQRVPLRRRGLIAVSVTRSAARERPKARRVGATHINELHCCAELLSARHERRRLAAVASRCR